MQLLIAQFLGFLLYPLGLAALGYGVGWTVGLSNTPAVAAMLPVVFGIAAAGAGVWLGRSDLAEPVDRGRFGLLGASLLLFALFAIHGTRTGLAERAARDRAADERGALADAARGAPEAPVDAPTELRPTGAQGPQLADVPLSDDPTEAIEALVLRRQLAAVGASPIEQQHVLMSVALAALERPSAASAAASTAARIRAELGIDATIVAAGLDAARREGPLADVRAWEYAAARLDALLGAQPTARRLADERVAVLAGLGDQLEGEPLDGGPALRAARGALATRTSLARADAAGLGASTADERRAAAARAALAELVRTLGDGAEAGVTVIERLVPVPTPAPVAPAATAFGDSAGYGTPAEDSRR